MVAFVFFCLVIVYCVERILLEERKYPEVVIFTHYISDHGWNGTQIRGLVMQFVTNCEYRHAITAFLVALHAFSYVNQVNILCR